MRLVRHVSALNYDSNLQVRVPYTLEIALSRLRQGSANGHLAGV